MAIYEQGAVTRFDALGFAQLTVSTTALALSASLPAGVSADQVLRILIQVDGTAGTNDIRFRDDGTAPTAAIGVKIAANSSFVYDGDPSAIQVIRANAADATVNIAFYGRE